jgi:hypothetical protein
VADRNHLAAGTAVDSLVAAHHSLAVLVEDNLISRKLVSNLKVPLCSALSLTLLLMLLATSVIIFSRHFSVSADES